MDFYFDHDAPEHAIKVCTDSIHKTIIIPKHLNYEKIVQWNYFLNGTLSNNQIIVSSQTTNSLIYKSFYQYIE